MSDVLWVAGRYHLGNDPGVFQNATYVGHELSLPFKKTWIDPDAAEVSIVISTAEIETWGAWQGHAVLINSTEIGRLKDPNDTIGGVERFEFTIPVSTFNAALNGRDDFLLRVTLDTQPAHPGLEDDFVITRIASSETLAAKIGWK